MNRPEVVEWIASHGGIVRIHTVPFVLGWSRSGKRKIGGWQNVYICQDGTRRGLSPAEEESLDGHHDYLIAARDAWRHP